ncbi:glycoside hydrolase/deacetylase [Sodiomyces alkalinus F11]|uniref:Glycoside hydrolase/deacetylase n=1 Tax=Sodiomyces alkalinus (strain CBS 110278 / VKM F-3762 / F11) TaxID=1314773 RepID=A0A3N2PUA5_SODAK|nr:glycoside hydrolase/deacetylase [Sodiomyces alkalinus F11]ROT38089.1 glycoside hydrolase/deacetylase [Sodiomyces alkalinus F11]
MYPFLSVLLLGSTALAATIDLPLRKRAVCGPGIGSCAPGLCCSQAGWCGTSPAHCGGSSCQLEYSDSCDTVIPPPGSSTEDVARDQIGSVPYGVRIRQCTEPKTLALTFDDGPYDYTSEMLDLLDDLDVKATFFVQGSRINRPRFDDESTQWPAVLRRMHDAGHHIASHTWTHRNLNQVDSDIQRSEIIHNEMAFRNVFGWIPTYFRAPFLECSVASGCQGLMNALGYHLIDASIDTKDYENNTPALAQIAKDRFLTGILQDPAEGGGHIVLAHDVHQQTVTNLTEFMVGTSLAHGYRLVTVGECLGDPKENWYRDVDGGSTTPTSATTTTTTSSSGPEPTSTFIISPDQTCGGATGYTCQGSAFGNCCSFYGYCGSSPSYCGTGCDNAFGSCLPQSPGISDTTNGLCGEAFQASCANYGDKKCCSPHGYCGNSATHCGVGCQSLFGECN